MDTAKFYDEWSVSYDTDSNRTRDLDEQVMRETFAELCFQNILELGCGTGKNTMFLAEICETLEAFDFSPNMIAKAKAKVQARNVSFIRADITTKWPREDSSVDLIVCNLVLEHIEKLSGLFAEARRTLVGSGRFFISELHPFRQYQGMKANFKRKIDTAKSLTAVNVGDSVDSVDSVESIETFQAIESEAFVHHISEFLQIAKEHKFVLEDLKEWWHHEDAGGTPRLVTLNFKKS